MVDIDDNDRAAARAIIANEGWPSRDRATDWLARILKASSRVMLAAVAHEREECAKVVDISANAAGQAYANANGDGRLQTICHYEARALRGAAAAVRARK